MANLTYFVYCEHTASKGWLVFSNSHAHTFFVTINKSNFLGLICYTFVSFTTLSDNLESVVSIITELKAKNG